MLARLSGGSHEVLSGVALIYGVEGAEPHIDTFVEKTAVDFGKLPAEVIDACKGRDIRRREYGGAGVWCGGVRCDARARFRQMWPRASRWTRRVRTASRVRAARSCPESAAATTTSSASPCIASAQSSTPAG
eukprot:6528030-Prymnesium_polylepis.1